MKTNLLAFNRVVAAEIAKLRTTFAFWLTLIYPLGTVMLISLFWFSQRNAKVIDSTQFISNLGNVGSFFLPFFIVLLISVACNTEHKSSMLKHLLSQPLPRPLVYTGKLAGIMLFILTALVLTLVFAYASLLILGFVSPQLGMGEGFDHLLLIGTLLKAYLASAVIYTFQYWLGMRLRNLTLPMAIGSGLIVLPIAILMIFGITGLLQKNQDFIRIITYDPYSYPYSTGFNMMKAPDHSLFPTLTLVYIGLSILILVLGAWNFSKRNIA
jgi:hypothetical protein